MKLRGIIAYVKLVLWAVIPLFLLLLPSTHFDRGKSYCLSQLLMDSDCPGCGITRGVQHAIHFEFLTAWEYNKLTVIVLPILFFIWITTLIKLIKKAKKINRKI